MCWFSSIQIFGAPPPSATFFSEPPLRVSKNFRSPPSISSSPPPLVILNELSLMFCVVVTDLFSCSTSDSSHYHRSLEEGGHFSFMAWFTLIGYFKPPFVISNFALQKNFVVHLFMNWQLGIPPVSDKAVCSHQLFSTSFWRDI